MLVSNIAITAIMQLIDLQIFIIFCFEGCLLEKSDQDVD